jgi:hypothetical protein
VNLARSTRRVAGRINYDTRAMESSSEVRMATVMRFGMNLGTLEYPSMAIGQLLDLQGVGNNNSMLFE